MIQPKPWAVALPLAMALCGSGHAQQLVYTPTIPNFGGSPLNSSHYLSLANAQNPFAQKDSLGTQSQGDLFASQLQSQLLSSLATQVTDSIFGQNAKDSGVFSFGGETISFVRDLGGVHLTLKDASGAVTEITVPTNVQIK